MTSESSHQETRGSADLRHDELSQWKRKVHSLPAVRFGKIEAVREALLHDSYENAHVLSETLARLGDDLGLGDLTVAEDGVASDPRHGFKDRSRPGPL